MSDLVKLILKVRLETMTKHYNDNWKDKSCTPLADCKYSSLRGLEPLSLYRLHTGGTEAGELELHAAFKLVQQLLQQPAR